MHTDGARAAIQATTQTTCVDTWVFRTGAKPFTAFLLCATAATLHPPREAQARTSAKSSQGPPTDTCVKLQPSRQDNIIFGMHFKVRNRNV